MTDHDVERSPLGSAPPGTGTLLVHEWLERTGGSENVFEVMRSALPAAAGFCLWNDSGGRFPDTIRESRLATTPVRSRKAAALPFMPRTWRRMPLGDADTVVASSHAFAHHAASVAVRDGRRGLAYVHTPARYLWARDLDQRGSSPAAAAVAAHLRRVDRRMASSQVAYAANSAYVAERIERCWDVPARVIHPPVDVERVRADAAALEVSASEAAMLAGLPAQFVLGASRFVPYKRLEMAVRVGELLDLPVVIAGEGPDEARLRAAAADARVPVHFVGRPSRPALAGLYAAASLFVFMAVEDFGIMPVEAIAVGTPVLVNEIGGASEIVARTSAGRAVPVDDEAALRTAATELVSGDLVVDAAASDVFATARFVAELHDWIGGHR